MRQDHVIVGEGAEARRIAVLRRGGGAPGVVWLGGYRSDMRGTKAEAVEAHLAGLGLACCRHDYSGHGESGGAFADGTISRWLEESHAVFDAFTDGPQVLIGSSMGAWVALRMAQLLAARGESHRLHAMLLISPAPDFTERLMRPQLSPAQLDELARTGRLEMPSRYAPEPNIYTRALFEDGAANVVMTPGLRAHCPVHILQGRQDPDVPWTHAVDLASLLAEDEVILTLLPDADHRLSRPDDIALILRSLDGLLARPFRNPTP